LKFITPFTLTRKPRFHKFWNTLPPDIQQAVMEAAAEVSQISLAQAEKEDAAALSEARKSMEVSVLEGEWPEARDAGLSAWRKRSGDETKALSCKAWLLPGVVNSYSQIYSYRKNFLIRHSSCWSFFFDSTGRNSKLIERRTSNVQHRTSNIDDATLYRF